MKTVITIFVLPQEIDDLERTLIQLKNSSKYLDNNHKIILDITLSLSPYLTNWELSKIPVEFFEDKFNQLKKYIDWCDSSSKFIISYDDKILGCVSKRRESWKYYNEVDNFLWLDTDLVFDERTLIYFITTASQLDNSKYIISPQTVRLWDNTWDCLVNDNFMNKPYGYERNECDPYLDSGIKGNVTVDIITSGIPTQPKMKFAGGWFTLISKELLDLVTIPDELGHYGLEDTFIMWAGEYISDSTQYLMKNVVVCEDYKYRNRLHYTKYIGSIDRKAEFLKIAHSHIQSCLNKLKQKLIP